MRRDRRRKAVVLLVAAALVAAGFGLGSLVRRDDTGFTLYDLYLQEMKNDPPLGTRVELPTRDVFGQGLDLANSHVLVVYEGLCIGCTLRPIIHQLPFDRFDRVLVVYESHADTVRPRMELDRAKHHPRLSIVADPEGWLVSALNLWDGRWAVVQNGSLTRLQQGPEDVTF